MDAPQVSEVEISFIKWLGGLFLAALGALIGIIYNKHEKDFDKLEAKVDKKADAEDIHERLEIGADKFSEMITEIRSLTAQMQTLNSTVLTELGKRPTRDEMTAYCQNMHRRGE